MAFSPARLYEQVAAEASDRRYLVVLLMESVVRFLTQAQEALRQRNYELHCDRLTRAQQILSTLLTALDREASPQLADALAASYVWMHNSLTEASLREDEALLQEVLDMANRLLEAWREAWQELRRAEAAAPASSAA